jgi:hypothetical protein
LYDGVVDRKQRVGGGLADEGFDTGTPQFLRIIDQRIPHPLVEQNVVQRFPPTRLAAQQMVFKGEVARPHRVDPRVHAIRKGTKQSRRVRLGIALPHFPFGAPSHPQPPLLSVQVQRRRADQLGESPLRSTGLEFQLKQPIARHDESQRANGVFP